MRLWSYVAVPILCLCMTGCVGDWAARTNPSTLPNQLSNLPIVSIEASGPTAERRFVIWLSGDGGWDDLARKTTKALAEDGVLTAGINTLRYFSKRRSKEEMASAVDNVVRTFSKRWGRYHFVLVGFSFGAGVVPFIADDLSPETLAKLDAIILISGSHYASFQVGPRTWLGMRGEEEIGPALARLKDVSITCIRGNLDTGSECPEQSRPHMRVVVLPGGHTLPGHSAEIARIVKQTVEAGAIPESQNAGAKQSGNRQT